MILVVDMQWMELIWMGSMVWVLDLAEEIVLVVGSCGGDRIGSGMDR